MKHLELLSKAADSISDGDLTDRMIHGFVPILFLGLGMEAKSLEVRSNIGRFCLCTPSLPQSDPHRSFMAPHEALEVEEEVGDRPSHSKFPKRLVPTADGRQVARPELQTEQIATTTYGHPDQDALAGLRRSSRD